MEDDGWPDTCIKTRRQMEEGGPDRAFGRRWLMTWSSFLDRRKQWVQRADRTRNVAMPGADMLAPRPGHQRLPPTSGPVAGCVSCHSEQTISEQTRARTKNKEEADQSRREQTQDPLAERVPQPEMLGCVCM